MKSLRWILGFLVLLVGATGCGGVDNNSDAPVADGALNPDAMPSVDAAGECVLGTGVLGVCRL